MALNGLAPIIIFNFFKEIPIPAFLKGFTDETKIPLIPIPIYLDEKLTKICINDYDRETTIDGLRDGVSSYERVSADVVNLKFVANKSNIVMTAITALIDVIVQNNVENKTYSITVFYDNIFILGAALENFNSRLLENTDQREISIRLANRPKEKVVAETPIANTAGTATGFVK